MAGQQRPFWASLLCVLLAAAAPCLCSDGMPLDAEPHSRALEPVHIGLIVTGFAVAGVFLLGLVIVLATRGRVHLSHLLVTLVMAVGLMVGISSWYVTYQQMRDKLQAKVELLIASTGHEVALSVLQTLDAGDRLSKLLSASVTHGAANVNDTFPTPIRQLHTIRQGFVGRDDAVTLFYYGNIWGYVYAVSSDPSPQIFYGFPNSAPHSEHTVFKCVGWDHPWADCTRCAPGNGQSCAPSCADQCGRSCFVHNTSNCYGNEGVSRLMIYTAEGSSGLPAGDVQAVNFEARSRPWFKFGMRPENADGKTHWMEPYVFDGISEHAVDLGFSSIVTALNPKTGVPEGVIATDYMIGSLAVVLRRVRPTPNSLIYLITLDGRVLSSSYPTTKNTVRPTRHADGTVTFEVEQVMTHHEPSIRALFHNIVDRVGSLRQAAMKRRLLQIRDTSVLMHSVNMTGMVMLVVVEVPDSDIFEEVNSASTVALAVVLGVSFAWSLLVAGLIAVMLSAIKTLEVEMREVAWMQMDPLARSGQQRSLIAEIFSMQKSFDMVAQNMLEYKQYLPQSLRADSSDTGQDASTSEPRSFKTASSATPNPMASTDQAGHVVPSVSSSDSSKSRVPGGQAEKRARLNLFGTKLREGKVSVVCCNVRGTHGLIEDSLHVSDFTHLYAVYLAAVLDECRRCQGVVDYFNGDRVCATFNAVRPSPQHVRKAVEFGLGVDHVVRGHQMALTQGMATGNALVGNAGCPGLKKFHVFSNVSSLAHALERYCREWGLDLVVGSAGVEACSHVFLSFDYVFSLLNLAKVWLPHEKQPSTVSRVLPQKVEGDAASWLFEVDKGSSYVHHNNALQAMYAGDYNGALQELACQELADGKQDLLLRIERCQQRGRPESPLRERWC